MRERNIINRLLLCPKWYQYIVWPWTNVGHLRFYQQSMSKVISNPTTRSGIPENPIVDTKIVSLLLFCRKIYQFIVWPWANGGHLGFSTYNAMSKIFSDNTTISGIPENPMIDTSNMNLPLLCRNVGHLRFYQQSMSKVISNPTTRSGIPENPIVDTKIVSLLLFCRKIYQFIVWPWANGGHLGFSTHNAMSKIFSDNTTISGIPENPMIDTSNMNLPLLFRNVGHLRFYRQSMSKIISNPTTRSGIPENPIVDTKIVSLLLFCRKIYQFIVWPWANGGNLGFSTHNAMSKIVSDSTTISGIPENPMIDTSNMNLPLLCRKWYWFTVWPEAKGGHLGFYQQCNVQSNFWPHY